MEATLVLIWKKIITNTDNDYLFLCWTKSRYSDFKSIFKWLGLYDWCRERYIRRMYCRTVLKAVEILNFDFSSDSRIKPNSIQYIKRSTVRQLTDFRYRLNSNVSIATANTHIKLYGFVVCLKSYITFDLSNKKKYLLYSSNINFYTYERTLSSKRQRKRSNNL